MTTSNEEAEAFFRLREAPLHAYGAAQWLTYDPAMIAFLTHPRADIRAMAIERLAMATLHWDYRHTDDAKQKNKVLPIRVERLLNAITAAHATYTDVIPEFLRNLRWHGDDPHIAPQLLRWLAEVESASPPVADPGMIRGTHILIAPPLQEDAQQTDQWIAYLDDPSDWVRGCAARKLASVIDDDENDNHDKKLVALIAAHEIARPGVAGPFSGEFYSGCAYGPWGDAPSMAEWMMDLLERRHGPAPGDMPFNDIDFFLHELCSTSPAMMQRMLDGGFVYLAYLTATEELHAVEGVKPILEQLTRVDHQQIAAAAANHLKRHYTSSA